MDRHLGRFGVPSRERYRPLSQRWPRPAPGDMGPAVRVLEVEDPSGPGTDVLTISQRRRPTGVLRAPPDSCRRNEPRYSPARPRIRSRQEQSNAAVGVSPTSRTHIMPFPRYNRLCRIRPIGLAGWRAVGFPGCPVAHRYVCVLRWTLVTGTRRRQPAKQRRRGRGTSCGRPGTAGGQPGRRTGHIATRTQSCRTGRRRSRMAIWAALPVFSKRVRRDIRHGQTLWLSPPIRT